jgi:hypothetical protein
MSCTHKGCPRVTANYHYDKMLDEYEQMVLVQKHYKMLDDHMKKLVRRGAYTHALYFYWHTYRPQVQVVHIPIYWLVQKCEYLVAKIQGKYREEYREEREARRHKPLKPLALARTPKAVQQS